MHPHTVTIVSSDRRTRVLLTQGPDELMRAILPPPSDVRYERAAATLLEGLSMWLDHKLHVVLSVDAQDASFCLGLTDELGVGHHRVFYDIAVTDRKARRRRGARIRGVGDFSDLRQLTLRDCGGVR